MTKRNIHVALRAQGGRGFDGVTGSRTSWGRWHRGLREDNCTVGSVMAQVDGVTGSETTRGAQCRGLGEDDIVAGLGTTSRAGRRRH
jgi:hypothetical protein